MPAGGSKNPRIPWAEFAIVAVAYAFIVFLLCPGTRFIAFAVHHDDFANLAHTTYTWYPWRPVSYAILMTLSRLGIPVYYTALHILIIVYAFLSLSVLRRLLDVRNTPVIVLLPVAAAMLSYEYTVEYSKYTGLITNLLSGVFAMCAMTLMVARGPSAPIEKPPRRLGFGGIAAVWIFSALSFWSKEDFLAPTLVLAAYLAWQIHRALPSDARKWFLLLAGLGVEAALLILYNRHMQSVFTQSTSGSYQPDFRPISILRTGYVYMILTPGAKMAFLLAASTVLSNGVGASRILWIRILAFLVLTSSIALPYLVLPNHVFYYYPLNWSVWETGGGLLVLWKLWPGIRTGMGIAILAAASLVVTQGRRSGLSDWYSEKAGINRNIVMSLAPHRARLDPYPAVAVEGAPLNGPWFGTSGEFLKNRLGMDHVWLVRASKQSDYWRASWALLGTDVHGDIKTVAIEDEPVSADMPLVKISEDGKATGPLSSG